MLFLLSILISSGSSWALGNLVPMKIVTISGYGVLPVEMQTELQLALKWFENAFLVKKLKYPLTRNDVMKRIPEYQKFSTVFVQSPERRGNFQWKSENIEKILGFADFSVFIVAKNPQECLKDPGLLAEALPISLIPNARPPLATMSICPRAEHPVRFFDLFRHEILHGMGYGMIIDKQRKTVKPSEKYFWKTPKGSQPANRHFLDFDEIALKSARTHFGCQTAKGIEADGPRKNHLNEYIFGNELMTTDLEGNGNFFSWISAGIIERTYNGNEQWYHVNQTFISSEANQYAYGKGFGCDFLEKSCFEFIKVTEEKHPNKSILPFCSKNHRNMCLTRPGFQPRSYPIDLQQCEHSHHFQIDMSQAADNGIRPLPGLPYHNVQKRFCPVMKSTHVPSKWRVEPCPGV